MVFTRAEHLSRHVRVHTGDKPFECHCGRFFTRLDNVRQHASTIHPEKRSENEETLKRLKGVHDSLLQTKRKASDGASQERPKRRRTRAASPKLEQSIEQECKNTMQDLDSPEAPRWAPPHPKPRLHSLTATSSEPTPYPRHLPPSPPIFQIPQDPLPQPPDYENPLIRADIASFLDGHRDGKAHSGEPMSFDEVADFLRGHWDRLTSGEGETTPRNLDGEESAWTGLLDPALR